MTIILNGRDFQREQELFHKMFTGVRKTTGNMTPPSPSSGSLSLFAFLLFFGGGGGKIELFHFSVEGGSSDVQLFGRP